MNKMSFLNAELKATMLVETVFAKFMMKMIPEAQNVPNIRLESNPGQSSSAPNPVPLEAPNSNPS
jgi:hypothetical protein